jgi:hypothetical protein
MKHWVSCNKFTVQVNTDERGIITWAAPVVHRFQGQPLTFLFRWAKGLGGLRHEVLNGT